MLMDTVVDMHGGIAVYTDDQGGGFRKSETGVIAQEEFPEVEEGRGGDRGG